MPRAGSAVHAIVTAPDVKPAPNATMHDAVADLDAAAVDRLGQRERHRRGRRVPVPVEVDEDPVHRQVEALGDGLDDPDVRLVRDEQVDVGGLQAGLLDRRRGPWRRASSWRTGRSPCPPSGCSARRARWSPADGGRCGPAGRHPDHVRARRLGRELEAERAAGLVRRRQHDRARAVAEEDAGVAVGVVEEPGQRLRPDHEHVLGHPARDVGVGGGVGVDEARAGRHRRPSRTARVLPIASFTSAAVDGIQ